MSTIESVMAADKELSAAFEELNVLRMVMAPKRRGGISIAMENANEVTDVEAKTNIWEKLKAFFKKFFDFILRRNKSVEDKSVEVVEKMDESHAKMKTWLDEMIKQGMAASQQQSTNAEQPVNDSGAKIQAAIKSKDSEIRSLLAKRITADTESSSILYTYLGVKVWGTKDFPLVKKKLDAVIQTCNNCDQFVKEYIAVLGSSSSNAKELTLIGNKVTQKAVEMPTTGLPMDGSGIKFDGNFQDFVKNLEAFQELLKKASTAIGNKAVLINNLHGAFDNAIQKAESAGDDAYAKALRDTLTIEVSSITFAYSIAKNHMAQLVTTAAMLMTTSIGVFNSEEGKALASSIKEATGAISASTVDLALRARVAELIK